MSNVFGSTGPQEGEEVRIVEQSQVTQPVRTTNSEVTQVGTEHVIERSGEENQVVVPLAEEYFDVSKQWVQSGEVIIRKTVDTHTQTIPVDVEYEEVQVDHVPVNRVLAYGEKTVPWWDGEVMVVPVIEEEVVVMKRQVLREELRIYKRRLTRQETVSETLRSEHVHVETTGNLRPANEEQPGGTDMGASTGKVGR